MHRKKAGFHVRGPNVYFDKIRRCRIKMQLTTNLNSSSDFECLIITANIVTVYLYFQNADLQKFKYNIHNKHPDL